MSKLLWLTWGQSVPGNALAVSRHRPRLLVKVAVWAVQAKKVLAAQERLAIGSVRNPADSERLRIAAGLTPLKFKRALHAARLHQVSLDNPVQHTTASGSALAEQDLLESIPAEADDALNEESCLAALEVRQALLQLPDQEAAFIRHKYGLLDGLPKSRLEVF